MRLFLAFLAALLLLAAPSRAGAVDCEVTGPISAADLNAGGTWTYAVTGGTPDAWYAVKIQWAGDPSNGGHPSDFIETDAAGDGSRTLGGQWATDGFLPVADPWASPMVFVPGEFSVHVYAGATGRATGAKGTANCSGTVTE